MVVSTLAEPFCWSAAKLSYTELRAQRKPKQDYTFCCNVSVLKKNILAHKQNNTHTHTPKKSEVGKLVVSSTNHLYDLGTSVPVPELYFAHL